MDTASRGEAAMWEAQRASATRLDYGAKVWGGDRALQGWGEAQRASVCRGGISAMRLD